MSHRTRLLQTVSSIAVASVATTSAHAAGAAADGAAKPVTLPLGYTVTFEGAFSMGEIEGNAKVGSGGSGSPFSGGIGLDADTMLGFTGAVTFNHRIDEQWDVGAGASAIYFATESSSLEKLGSGAPFSGFSAPPTLAISQERDASFQMIDFEVGYRPLVGQSFDLRLFAGLRGLHATKSLDKLGTISGPASGDSGGSGGSAYSGFATIGYGIKVEDDFLGIGPRVGAAFSKRFENSRLGLSGMVGGAVFFGREKREATIYVTSSFVGSGDPFSGKSVPSGASGFSSTESEIVYNLDASIGIDYFLSESTIVTLGYKAQQFWNIGTVLSTSPTDGDQPYDLIHGPFLKLTSSF